jgi:hypothetical protein
MNDDPTRSPGAISRRTALAGLGAGSLGLALAATTRQADAQDATPFPMAGHPIVGTWIVDRNPDDAADPPTAIVVAADGGWIDPVLGVAGTWQATGPHSAAWTAIGLLDGGAGGYFALRTSAEIDDAGTYFAGTASVTIVAPDGTVVTTIAGGPASHGVRLQVEPVEAGGTPLTGVPAWTPPPPADATPTA